MENKCKDCSEREGIIDFCEGGAVGYVHGFKRKICRRCYIVRIEVELEKIKENLAKQKKLLAEEEKDREKTEC